MDATTLRARHAALAPSESRLQALGRAQLHNVTFLDLVDELIDAEAALMAAVEKNDPALIGRIVLAVRANYAEHLANHDSFNGALRLPGADVVAAKVLAS